MLITLPSPITIENTLPDAVRQGHEYARQTFDAKKRKIEQDVQRGSGFGDNNPLTSWEQECLALEQMVKDLNNHREVISSALTDMDDGTKTVDEAVAEVNAVIGHLAGMRKFVDDFMHHLPGQALSDDDLLKERLNTRIEVAQEEAIRRMNKKLWQLNRPELDFDPGKGGYFAP